MAADDQPRTGVPVGGVLLSLWRAAVVFRIVAATLVCYLVIRWRDLYAEPAVAYGVAAAVLVVTGVVAVLGLLTFVAGLCLVATAWSGRTR